MKVTISIIKLINSLQIITIISQECTISHIHLQITTTTITLTNGSSNSSSNNHSSNLEVTIIQHPNGLRVW